MKRWTAQTAKANRETGSERASSRVIPDLAISRAAPRCADAPIVATQRVHKPFDEDDLDRVAVWKRILHAVDELQRVKPKEGESVN